MKRKRKKQNDDVNRKREANMGGTHEEGKGHGCQKPENTLLKADRRRRRGMSSSFDFSHFCHDEFTFRAHAQTGLFRDYSYNKKFHRKKGDRNSERHQQTI
jgi:hypothetical protein